MILGVNGLQIFTTAYALYMWNTTYDMATTDPKMTFGKVFSLGVYVTLGSRIFANLTEIIFYVLTKLDSNFVVPRL